MKKYVLLISLVVCSVTLLFFSYKIQADAKSFKLTDSSNAITEYRTPTPRTIIINKITYKVFDTSTRSIYFPLKDCAPSRLRVGDQAYIPLGGGSNGIRKTADVHPRDNIIGKAVEGEGIKIIGGPECSYGWILWKVSTDGGLIGWTPESNGKEFWISPIDAKLRTANSQRQFYIPVKDCAYSRLYVGDRVYVSFGGGANGIRKTADTHPKDNIVGRVQEGKGMIITGGPVCNWGWVLWKVKADNGLVGWTPEGNGKELWLIPIDSPLSLPKSIKDNATYYDLYNKMNSIMSDSKLTYVQKQEKVRILQRNFGEEAVATVIRYVPVYDEDSKTIMSFDSYIRKFAGEIAPSTSSSPIEQDPTGAAWRIFNDTSEDTIKKMLGW